MTDERQGDDDFANPTFDSDAERAEHEWLIAREANPDAPPPSSEVAQRYAHLESLLSSLPPPTPDPADDAQWQEALLCRAAERAASPPTPIRRAWTRRPVTYGAVGVGLAAAAILLIFLYPRKPTGDLDTVALAYTVTHAGTQRAAPQDAALHDYFESQIPNGEHDLRLYRPDGTLAARCPGGPGCTTTSSGSQLRVQLDLPGRYSVFLVIGTTKLPVEGTKSEFLERVRVAHARMKPPRVFDVE